MSRQLKRGGPQSWTKGDGQDVGTGRSEDVSMLTSDDRSMYRRWVRYVVAFYALCVGGLWFLAVVTKSEIEPHTAAAAPAATEYRANPAPPRNASTVPVAGP